MGKAVDLLNMLIPKLPSPQEDDFSQGILEAIDLDSYRIEKRETISLILPDEDALRWNRFPPAPRKENRNPK